MSLLLVLVFVPRDPTLRPGGPISGQAISELALSGNQFVAPPAPSGAETEYVITYVRRRGR